MKIAIIDEGIDKRNFKNIKEEFDLSIKENGTISMRTVEEKICTNHGWICGQIIRNYFPSAEIISIRIFEDQTLKTTVSKLNKALSWCLGKQIKIIHLSIGTSELCDDAKLQPVIAKLLKEGKIIVAAKNNYRQVSFPGIYAGVVSVEADEHFSEDHFEVQKAIQSDYEIKASSRHFLQYNKKRTIISPMANSYAAPLVTARIAQLIWRDKDNLNPQEIFYRLGFDLNWGCCVFPDFMINPTFIYRRRNRINYMDMFFEKAKGDEWHKKCFFTKNLVYISSEHSEKGVKEFQKFILKLKLKPGYYNIFYIGRMFSEDKKKINVSSKIKIWTTKQNALLSNQNNIIPKEVPIVYITGPNMLAVKILCFVRDKLHRERFNCLCCSDHVLSMLYRIHYVSPKCKVYGQYYNIFLPHIIIVYEVKKTNLSWMEENAFCIHIRRKKEKVHLCIHFGDKEYSLRSKYLDETFLGRVYEKIITSFQ